MPRASNAFPGHDDHPVQATVQAQVREAVKAAIDAGTTVFPRHRSHKAVTMVLQALVGVQEPTEVLVTALLNGLDTQFFSEADQWIEGGSAARRRLLVIDY